MVQYSKAAEAAHTTLTWMNSRIQNELCSHNGMLEIGMLQERLVDLLAAGEQQFGDDGGPENPVVDGFVSQQWQRDDHLVNGDFMRRRPYCYRVLSDKPSMFVIADEGRHNGLTVWRYYRAHTLISALISPASGPYMTWEEAARACIRDQDVPKMIGVPTDLRQWQLHDDKAAMWVRLAEDDTAYYVQVERSRYRWAFDAGDVSGESGFDFDHPEDAARAAENDIACRAVAHVDSNGLVEDGFMLAWRTDEDTQVWRRDDPFNPNKEYRAYIDIAGSTDHFGYRYRWGHYTKGTISPFEGEAGFESILAAASDCDLHIKRKLMKSKPVQMQAPAPTAPDPWKYLNDSPRTRYLKEGEIYTCVYRNTVGRWYYDVYRNGMQVVGTRALGYKRAERAMAIALKAHRRAVEGA